MRCDLVPDVFYHVRKPGRGVVDTTAPLFVEYLTLYEMGQLGRWFDLSDPDTCTAKALVGAQVQVLPNPDVQLNYSGTDWPTVWKRWQSLSKISHNILFFFLHDKTMTRVFIKKIYPITDDSCQCCKRGPETQDHRYFG